MNPDKVTDLHEYRDKRAADEDSFQRHVNKANRLNLTGQKLNDYEINAGKQEGDYFSDKILGKINEKIKQNPRLAKIGGGILIAFMLAGGVYANYKQITDKSPREVTQISDINHESTHQIETLKKMSGVEIANVSNINVSKDARFRREPFVDTVEAGNVEFMAGSDIKIEVNGEVYIKVDELNGDWIGVPIEFLKYFFPDIADSNDPDGVLWVNSQMASIDKENSSEQ